MDNNVEQCDGAEATKTSLIKRVGWLGIVAILFWIGTLGNLLLGGFLSAFFWALAGLMAWNPAFAVKGGKPAFPGGMRVALGLAFWVTAALTQPASVLMPKIAETDEAPATPVELSTSDLPGQTQEAQVSEASADPSNGAEIVKIQPRKEGFGSILEMDITIQNHGMAAVKDFVITCSNKGKSGTEIDTNTRTVYERLDAGSTQTFRKINMGFIDSQTSSTNCKIDAASID